VALEDTEQPAQLVAQLDSYVSAADLLPVRVQALTDVGRAPEAEALVMACRRAVEGRHAPAAVAALATADAILTESRGDVQRAAERFGEAAHLWAGLPRPYDALLARERQARCLLPSDEQAGSALLVETLRGLTRLGAAGDVDRLVGLLRRHGVETRGPGWRGGRTGYGNRLSPRETEVVRLVIAGHTNREIADILFRSVRTVETQVRSAMRKLDVTSRTALAVQAAELDLAEPDDSR
jgi:DNA-binding CsgD family transcriptional regulator